MTQNEPHRMITMLRVSAALLLVAGSHQFRERNRAGELVGGAGRSPDARRRHGDRVLGPHAEAPQGEVTPPRFSVLT